MKLHKLLYYCQAWSVVWSHPIFPEPVEAWINGPVVRDVYDKHKGQYQIETWKFGDADNLNASEKNTVDKILAYYGNRSSQWLSDLTHQESPWKMARGNMPLNVRGSAEISLAEMEEYYSSLPPDAKQ
jgi:uncharacterized phage-associated protein